MKTQMLLFILYVFVMAGCGKSEIMDISCDNSETISSIINTAKGNYFQLSSDCQLNDQQTIEITRPGVTIDGQNHTVVSDSSSRPVFHVKAKNTLIQNITLANGNRGISVDDDASVVMKDVHTNGNQYGFYIGSTDPDKLPGLKQLYQRGSLHEHKFERPDSTLQIKAALKTGELLLSDLLIAQVYASPVPDCTHRTGNGSLTSLILNETIAVLCGNNSSNDNIAGIFLSGNSSLIIRSTKTVINNIQSGIVVFGGSTLHVDCAAEIRATNLMLDTESELTCAPAVSNSCISPKLFITNKLVKGPTGFSDLQSSSCDIQSTS